MEEGGGAGLRAITAKQEDDNEAEAVASEARRPRRRDVEPHWRGSNFGEMRILSCAAA